MAITWRETPKPNDVGTNQMRWRHMARKPQTLKLLKHGGQLETLSAHKERHVAQVGPSLLLFSLLLLSLLSASSVIAGSLEVFVALLLFSLLLFSLLLFSLLLFALLLFSLLLFSLLLLASSC
jgi:hypothetical protein